MALDADGGWMWMVVECGWWVDADGGWTSMVVGHGWWLNVDGYRLNADGGWTRMSRKKNKKSEKTYSWSC